MPTVQMILTWILIAILVVVAIIVLFRLLDILEAKAAAAAPNAIVRIASPAESDAAPGA